MSNPCRIAKVLTCVTVLAALAASAGAAVPTILLDLPQAGPLGDAVAGAAAHLQLQGYGVSWLQQHQPGADRDVVAIATMSGATLRTEAADQLSQAVREGTGLIYLLSSDGTQLGQDAAFLNNLGLQLSQAAAAQVAELRLARHEILENIRQLSGPAIPFRITGRTQTVLVEQNADAIAVASTLGKGRIVVLPLDMIGTQSPGQPLSVSEVRLLAQAMHWATGSIMAQKAYAPGQQPQPSAQTGYKKPDKQPLPPPLPQPGDVRSDPPTAGPSEPARTPEPPLMASAPSLASTALWDMGGEDDRWPQVAEVVRQAVEGAGLGVREIRVREDREPEPLVTRMPAASSLLVIGSHRDFSQAEAQAVGAHVRSGGALLAVANAAPAYQLRMVSLNNILAEFGLAVRLTRPGGRAIVADLPLTRLVSLQQLPPGISVWGFNDWQLVRVGNEAAASAQLHHNGRVVVLDGTMLIATDNRVATEFRQLLTNAVQWLTGQQ